MAVTIKDIIKCLDEIAPFSIAESWDNVGLLVGDRSREVQRVLVGLDPTLKLLDEALSCGADTVVTHHPAIFKPVSAIDTAEPSGRFLEKALKNQLNVFACHTNFDTIAPGVSDVLARLLGLEDIRPLAVDTPQLTEGAGTGRLGFYHQPLDRATFIDRLLDILERSSVQMAGRLPEIISSVALCGGSGSAFAEAARNRGADLFISAEIKHDVARWAEEADFCIIDGTHYATEKPALKLLVEKMQAYAKTHRWDITISESTTESHPFSPVDKNSYRKQ
ncbi:MAG: Nif3-like dinuclear metal center hexameric protein [Desulfocapsaceae bacterium]|jgi:dinuclear metal center YbgI/SA1388 family protein|nr:Nif3-like dinuclear metal center hexameric protein [Desulfocapsaceae bacterium]